MPFNENKKIYCADDYMGYAIDVFEVFLNSFTKEDGLIRDPNEDDSEFDTPVEFMYTNKGMRLAERMHERLMQIGSAHFPNEDIEIETFLYREQ